MDKPICLNQESPKLIAEWYIWDFIAFIKINVSSVWYLFGNLIKVGEKWIKESKMPLTVAYKLTS